MNIRQAVRSDACRIAEIEIFNYRLNFYPIFQNDEFYFSELQVASAMDELDPESLQNTLVYDDGVVKGFVLAEHREIRKLFVEPALQGRSIGADLLEYAVTELGAGFLWALEKNDRAIAFYQKHGFALTGEKIPEEDTTEFLVKMKLWCPPSSITPPARPI